MPSWNRRPEGMDILDWVLGRGVRTPTGCLVTPGAKNGPRNYPTVRNEQGKVVRLSKYVFERLHRALEPGEQVLHRCDFPPCYDPEHLFAGTVLDNMRDRKDKGREYRASGEHHPSARLTNAQANLIRELYAAGAQQNELARQFGIHQTTVSRIVLQKSYAIG